MDLEDQLGVMAEDWFGDASEESIRKARKIVALKSTSSEAMPYVAAILGVEKIERQNEGVENASQAA